MPKSKLFWALMSAFQIIFGLVVFIVTRNVYLDDSFGSGNRPSDIAPISSVENRQSLDINPAMLRSLMDLEPDSADPAAISMLANEYFEDGRYAEAAEFYEQLLAFGPSNADVQTILA